jgi:prophage regulatory protein
MRLIVRRQNDRCSTVNGSSRSIGTELNHRPGECDVQMPSPPTNAPVRPRLLRRKEVLSMVGLSQSSLYEQIAAGQFPAPIPIGANSVAWLESEIWGWIQQCIEERDRRRARPPQVMRF